MKTYKILLYLQAAEHLYKTEDDILIVVENSINNQTGIYNCEVVRCEERTDED